MNISRNIALATSSLLVGAFAAVPLTAQDPGQHLQPAPSDQAVNIVQHDKLLGASVTNALGDQPDQELGEVSDLVVEGGSGTVTHAVLSHEGKKKPIAWTALTWDAQASHFTLSMSPETLEKLPDFDPDNLDNLSSVGLTDASGRRGVSVGRDAANEEGEATDGGVRAGAGRSVPGSKTCVLASKIGDCKVVAGQEDVGSCDKLFIEPRSGAVPFVSVSSGGVLGIGDTNYLIPWRALRVAPATGDQAQVSKLQLDKTKDALKTAPKLGEAGADVNKPEFRRRVYEFYGVRAPDFEPMQSDAGKEPPTGTDRPDRSGGDGR
jgi:hypothetical protein